MKYNRYQYGGKSACDDVMNNFNLCDILNSAIRVIIENIVEKPINAIIDIVNNYIGQMNNFIWLILNYITRVFSTIISILNGPIIAVNILTHELKEILLLSINVLNGDILSIGIIYILPFIIYYQSVIFSLLDTIQLPFQYIFQSIFGIFGIQTNSLEYFSLYHLLLIARYILLIIYIICFYGFIKLIF